MLDFIDFASIDTETLIIWMASIGGFLAVLAVAIPFLPIDHRASRLKAVSKQREALSQRQIEGMNKPRLQTKQSGKQEFMKTVLTKLKMDDPVSAAKTKQQLAQAGFRNQQALITYGFTRVAALVGGLAFTLFVVSFWQNFPYPPAFKAVIVFIGAVAGWYLPRILLVNMAQKRQFAMTRSFPDAMDLLVICVESGLSVESAFDKVTEEITGQAPELGQEFGILSAELAYLGDRHKAFENFAERCGIPAAKSLATTLIQSERYGTPVGQALKVLSQEKRDERMSLAEKKGAALPAKLTVPMIVFFLPLLFMVIIGPAAIQIIRM